MSSVTGGKAIEIPGFGSVTEGPDARRLGAVLGMAVGDALGTTYEFERIDQPAYPTLATGPATDVIGGGPFDLPAGAITDDTQMAVCLARSIAEHGRVAPDDIARRYVAWSRHAFDIGNQTSGAMSAITNGARAEEAGREVWHRSGRRAAGNGSLMRTAPIGAAVEDVIAASVVESLITHADPRCVLSCAAFNRAIQGAVQGEQDLLALARTSIQPAADVLRSRWSDNADDLRAIDSAVVDIERDLDAAASNDPGVYGAEFDLQRTAGFVRVAFRLAFWHVVHTPSWRDAVIDTASRGADADTNAAIVGALVGARDGVHAIPAAWLDRVLAATQRGPREWGEAHHPRHLVSMLRR